MSPKPILREATEADLSTLLPLVRGYHEFEQVDMSDAARSEALRPLLNDPSLGLIWLIEVGGEAIGYIAICFGYSIEFQGRDAFVDEFYIAPPRRGEGHGRACLDAACQLAARLDVKALHLEVARDNSKAKRLYVSAGFEDRERFQMMSRTY